ncbi:MAG: hypothetical protein Q8R18_03440 [bacterium]|nr:hypothetical protein [bacterium]
MNEEEIQRIFADPENQRRVNVWYQREVDYTEQALYKQLGEKQPYIKEIFDSTKSQTGIENRNNLKVMRDTLEILLGLQTLESTLTILVRKAQEIVDRCIPEIDRFYLALIAQTKSLEREYGKTMEEIVKEEQYRDEIYRRIFPTREEAEMYMVLSHELAKGVIGIEKVLNKNQKTTESEREEEMKLEFLKAIRGYKRKEFDRIYDIYN